MRFSLPEPSTKLLVCIYAGFNNISSFPPQRKQNITTKEKKGKELLNIHGREHGFVTLGWTCWQQAEFVWVNKTTENTTVNVKTNSNGKNLKFSSISMLFYICNKTKSNECVL